MPQRTQLVSDRLLDARLIFWLGTRTLEPLTEEPVGSQEERGKRRQPDHDEARDVTEARHEPPCQPRAERALVWLRDDAAVPEVEEHAEHH